MNPYWFALLMSCTTTLAMAPAAMAQDGADGIGLETADELPTANHAHPEAGVAPLSLPQAGSPMKIYRERRDPGSVARQLEDYRACMNRVRSLAAAGGNAVSDPRETCRTTMAEVEQQMSPQLRQALVAARAVESGVALEP